MKNLPIKLFIFFFSYLILGMLCLLLMEPAGSLDSISSFSLVYLVTVSGIIFIQIDIVLVFLPLLYYWYKFYGNREINLLYILLTWIYLILFFLWLISSEFNKQVEFSRADQAFMILVIAKVIISLIVTFVSIYKILKSKYSSNYKMYFYS